LEMILIKDGALKKSPIKGKGSEKVDYVAFLALSKGVITSPCFSAAGHMTTCLPGALN